MDEELTEYSIIKEKIKDAVQEYNAVSVASALMCMWIPMLLEIGMSPDRIIEFTKKALKAIEEYRSNEKAKESK